MPNEFHREYLVRLPLPLAQLYSRAYNAPAARARHDNAFYLFEALIKLAACPLVAAYLREVEQGGQRVEKLDRLLAQLALPSLGQWVAILRELSKQIGQRPDAESHPLGHVWKQLDVKRRDRPAMLALFRRIKNGADGKPAGDQSCSLLQLLEAMVLYRNGVFGHGAGRFESFFEEEMGPLIFPAANEILAEGTFGMLGPAGARLVYVSELRTIDENRVEMSLSELVGLQSERMAPLEVSSKEAAGLVPNCVAVSWPGRRAPVRLDPLLVFRSSELTDEVLFLNRDRNGKQVEYLSYSTGRIERDKSMAPAMARLLSRITGRDVSEDELDQLQQQSLAETPSVEALFPDGNMVATSSVDGAVRRWRAETGWPIRPVLMHSGYIFSVAFSSDGKSILTGSRDRTARLWSAPTGTPIGEPLQHEHGVQAIFGPAGETILTGENQPVGGFEYAARAARLWHVKTQTAFGKPMLHGDGIDAMAFSPDGRRVLTGSRDESAQLWDARSGVPVGDRMRHPLAVKSVSFSPGGRTMTTTCIDGIARLWRSRTAETLQHDSPIRRVAYSPDSATVLTATKEGTARLWNVQTGEPIGEMLRHTDSVDAISFSPDGTRVLTGSRDATARLWNARTGEPQSQAMLHEAPVTLVLFSPDGQIVLTASNEKTAWLWDSQTGTLIGEPMLHASRVTTAAFSSDSQTVLTGSSDEFARRWDARSGKPIGKPILSIGTIDAVALTANGEKIVAGCREREARLWNGQTWKRLNVAVHEPYDVEVADFYDPVVRFSPNAKVLLTSDPNRTVQLWDAETGMPLGKPLLHKHVVVDACFHSDESIVLTASFDGSAQLWDVVTGKAIGEPLRHPEINSVAFARDGKHVVTAGRDATARIWYIGLPVPDDDQFLQAWSRARTALYVDNQGLTHRVPEDEWLKCWEELAKDHPEWLKAQESDEEHSNLVWHRNQVAESIAEENWSAAQFHLQCLLAQSPDDPKLLSQLRETESRVGSTCSGEDKSTMSDTPCN